MVDVLIKAVGFVFIIFLSFFLKKRGVFKLSDKDFLGNILLMICLPCVIISGFKSFVFDMSVIVAIALGIAMNLGGIIVGYVTTIGKTKERKTLQMMASSGYNIGIFTIPFVSSFLSGGALIATMMFDMGNALMVFGTSAAITSALVHKTKGNPLPNILKRLSKSVAFVVYVIMIILVSFGIHLPEQVYIITDIGASATGFLAMVMIGVLFEFKINKSEIKDVVSTVTIRYIYSILACVGIYFLPFPIEVRKAIIIAILSPFSTASVVYTEKLGCKPSVTGVVSSLCIVISMILIVGTIILL